MSTYHHLLLITALSSALLTFFLLQAGGSDFSSNQQNPSQQLQSTPLPQATEYFALGQPRLMTLAWQPCIENACQPEFATYSGITTRQLSEIGI